MSLFEYKRNGKEQTVSAAGLRRYGKDYYKSRDAENFHRLLQIGGAEIMNKISGFAKRLGKKKLIIIGATALAIILVVIIIVAVVSCGNGRNGENNNGGNTVARGMSATARDGKIELNGAVLDFGANSVGNGTATAWLLKPTKAQQPEDAISAFYDFEINPECNEPVTFKIPVDESKAYERTPNTVAMYALGSVFADDNGKEYTLYSYLPVEISGGIATVSFVPSEYMQNFASLGAGGSGRQIPSNFKTKGVIRFLESMYEDGGKFNLHHSRGLKLTDDDLKLILNDLEAAYDYYGGKGFKYDGREAWPMEVYIQDTGETLGDYCSGSNPQDGYISLSDKHFNQHYGREVMKPVIYHEFFHFAQGCYLKQAKLNFGAPVWFLEATTTYFESVIAGEMSDNISKNWDLLLQGVFPPSADALKAGLPEKSGASWLWSKGTDWVTKEKDKTVMKAIDNHGYARGALIKYLAEHAPSNDNGDGFILDVFAAKPSANGYDGEIGTATNYLTGAGAFAADYYETLLSNRLGVFENATEISAYAQGGSRALFLELSGEKPKKDEKTVSVDAYGAQMVGLNPNRLRNDGKFTSEYAPTITVTGTKAEWFVLAFNNKEKTAGVIKPQDGKVTLDTFFNDTQTNGIRYSVAVVGLHDSGKAEHIVKIIGDDDYQPGSVKCVGESVGVLYLDTIIRKEPAVLYPVLFWGIDLEGLPTGLRNSADSKQNCVLIERTISSRASFTKAGTQNFISDVKAYTWDSVQVYADDENSFYMNWKDCMPGSTVTMKIYVYDQKTGVKGDLIWQYSHNLPDYQWTEEDYGAEFWEFYNELISQLPKIEYD